MPPAESGSLLKPKQIAVSVAACFALHAAQLQANPTGPTVVHGGVGFSGLGTSALTITNQAGGNAVINWNGFSIGVNELTKFQQFANLAVLNRVTGNELSSILGALQSDGRIFLINPNGIVFGASARVDVAGMVASSLNLSDQDFLANRLRFTEVPGAGAVVNNGVIQTAAGGRVYLVAPTVENNGLIQSPQGAIVLAAGREIELVDANAPYLTVKVAAAADSAVNVGNLVADSGRIGMFGALVRNAGTVAANGAVAGPGGEIRLVASNDLTLEAGSLVAANGTSGGSVLLQAAGGTNIVAGTVEAKGSTGAGGQVNALGVRVGVVGHGVIDASGDAGGGTVLVGGDYQGKNAAVQNAERTYIGSDGVIRADAMTTGDGGRVIVWADGDTRFYGSISARGGSESGNGGFVETSGKQSLQAFGLVNAGAPNGQGGTWLLDPADININPGNPPDNGLIESDGQLLFGDATPEPTVVGASSIETALAYGYGSVVLQATNDITFNGNLNITNPGALTLQAGNDIRFNLYSLSLHGNLTLEADAAGGATTATGAITSVPGGGNITTNGGDFVASGVSISLGTIDTKVAVMDTFNGSYGGGAVNLFASAGNISAGGVTTGGGAMWASAPYGAIAINGSINTSNSTGNQFGSVNGSVTLSAMGDIVTGPITTRSLHPFYGSGGSVGLITTDGVIVVNGDIDTRGASGSTQPIDTCQDGCLDYFYGGSQGGSVGLLRNGTSLPAGGIAVQVNGNILTSGGDGLSGAAMGFGVTDLSGGAGGSVIIGGSGGLIGQTVQVLVKVDVIQIGAGPLQGDVKIAGSIDASGGNAGSSIVPDAVVNGGSGGLVSVFAYGNINAGPISARGGRGGDGVDGIVYGNAGGWGGAARIFSGGTAALGKIDVAGGDGGNSASSLSGSVGGSGGQGGQALVYGMGEVLLNVGGTLGAVAIDASGGAGGNGNPAASPAGDGGNGGGGGIVQVYGTPNMTFFGSVNASGGAGGAGGAGNATIQGGAGGAGGNAGSIYLDASSSTGSATGDGIIFVLAGTQFNVQGGAGGAGGADLGAGAGAGGAAGSTSTFNSMSDYFGTIVILDPLSIPEVNSSFQQTINGSDDSTVFVGGEDDKSKDEDKSKKEFGSCKG